MTRPRRFLRSGFFASIASLCAIVAGVALYDHVSEVLGIVTVLIGCVGLVLFKYARTWRHPWR